MSDQTRSASDDYPNLAWFASAASGREPELVGRRKETRRALDEIDTLRRKIEDLSLALIEARNPGIDMDAVKAQRGVAR